MGHFWADCKAPSGKFGITSCTNKDCLDLLLSEIISYFFTKNNTHSKNLHCSTVLIDVKTCMCDPCIYLCPCRTTPETDTRDGAGDRWRTTLVRFQPHFLSSLLSDWKVSQKEGCYAIKTCVEFPQYFWSDDIHKSDPLLFKHLLAAFRC